MVISEPLMVNDRVSPSGSLAVTVPIAVWFSAALKVAFEVKVGGSLASVTLTVMSWVVVFVPSETVTVAE